MRHRLAELYLSRRKRYTYLTPGTDFAAGSEALMD